MASAAPGRKPIGRPKDRGPLTPAEKMRLMRDRRRLLFRLGDCVPTMTEGIEKILAARDKDGLPSHPDFMAASRLIAERILPVRETLEIGITDGRVEINFAQLEAEEREVERIATKGTYKPLRIVRLPGDAPDEVSNGHGSPHTGAEAS